MTAKSLDIRCKLCEGPLKTVAEDLHDNRYGLPGAYSIMYCAKCGLGETFPRPSYEELPAIYEGAIGDSPAGFLKRIYRKCKRSAMGTSLILRLDRAGNFFALFPSPATRPTLLDIGCGAGDWLMIFEKMGFDATGVDLNPRVVETALGRGLNVECRRIEELVASGERYDVVVLSQILEHLSEPQEVLRTVEGLLAAGGSLVVAVPNYDSSWRRYFKNKWINWYMPFHIFHFTKRSLLKSLDAAGFKTQRALTYTPSSWWISSLMVKLFDKEGAPNPRVNRWWHFLLMPFVSLVLSVYEKLFGTLEGDCLCVVATAKDE